MKAIEILKEAKALIEKGWTKGHYAKSEVGGVEFDTQIGDEDATCFCSIGALCRANGHSPEILGVVLKEDPECAKAHSTLGKHMGKLLQSDDAPYKLLSFGTSHIIQANDLHSTTKEQVVAAFDAAIKELTQ